jgi:hypothetical protein
MLAIEAGEHRCLRPGCGRRLTARSSVLRGYGPRCWARIRRAAVAAEDSGNAVAAKAATLLRDAALVPSGTHPGIWLCPSQDGSRLYRVSTKGCSCTAGVHCVFCSHRFAAYVLAA